MPIFVKNDKAFLFVHIPKAGGSSLTELFKRGGYSIHWLDWGGASSLNAYRWCSPQHMHAMPLKTVLDLSRFKAIFCLVRHPMDRFKSEYRFQKGAALTDSPQAFSAWVESTILAYGSNNYLFDNHVRPQSEFILPGAEVFKLEHGADKLIEALRDRFGVELPAHPLRAQPLSRAGKPSLPAAAIAVTSATRRKIIDFYRSDYEMFDYKVE